jgi:hypothetical protein
MKAPICPICGVNERSYDSEPGGGGYFSHCLRCFWLINQAEHNHTIYPSPAQVAAGTYKAGHTWRTAQTVHPIIENNVHVGYRCVGVHSELCKWERRFTAEEMEPCPKGYPKLRHQCHRSSEHRLERGEIDERGYLTELGRAAERAHTDATNWDPGRYIERR